MSSLENHLQRAEEFLAQANVSDLRAPKVEMWFLAAYHLIEACAAKARLHIMKHQKVADELRRNPTILGEDSDRVAEAFRYLDHVARSKFVYGASGSEEDFQEARSNFALIEEICRRHLR
ncbi:MAG: hypothetical protein KGJ23_12400 [Euryarchaeota archaeon]|nr:hypothetical protein [Euryarchaeota archaeon]MDE1837398.1 hypothetical protein [Euryarchaeota archaeon]MDE1879919.1 hypothetical protein [Euryarchaeota archaeon]MDE2045502.1 hypothetical protein [Thermoplasmata archaeon]